MGCGDGTIVCAEYKDDALVKVSFDRYEGDDVEFGVEKEADRIVVMLWDSIDGMSPVCEAKTVE